MKRNSKTLLAFILAAGFFLVESAAAQPAKKAGYLDGVFLKEIEKIPENKISLSKTVFDITRKANKDLQGGSFRTGPAEQKLRSMADDIKKEVGANAGSIQRVIAINNYLFEDQKFSADRSRLFKSELDELLINRVFERKQGQCLSLSLVYLLIAEQLDWPLYGVMVPGHFFVRYTDNEGSTNIETTDQGSNRSDDYYRRAYLKGYDDKVSLKNLSKKEVVAVYLSNLANQYKMQGRLEQAIEIFKSAIRLMPGRPSFYTNLGNAYERNKNISKAALQYRQALNLNPYLCEAHYNLGLIHFLYTKDYASARRHGLVAQKLGCRMHPHFKLFLEKNKK